MDVNNRQTTFSQVVLRHHILDHAAAERRPFATIKGTSCVTVLATTDSYFVGPLPQSLSMLSENALALHRVRNSQRSLQALIPWILGECLGEVDEISVYVDAIMVTTTTMS